MVELFASVDSLKSPVARLAKKSPRASEARLIFFSITFWMLRLRPQRRSFSFCKINCIRLSTSFSGLVSNPIQLIFYSHFKKKASIVKAFFSVANLLIYSPIRLRIHRRSYAGSRIHSGRGCTLEY